VTELLHNTYGPCSRTVRVEIQPVMGVVARFPGCRPEGQRTVDLDSAHDGIWTSGLGVAPDLVKRLERFWEDLDLVGASMIFPWREELGAHPCLEARNPLLVLNVLARTRSTLLMARSPLDLGVECLERTLVSTDPALVALVERCEGRRRDEP